MNSVVMTINFVIIFLGCYLLLYILGGMIQDKIYNILINIVSNTSKAYYWIYFFINTIIKYGIIILSIILSTKCTFKYFVCYKDDGEKVHNTCTILLGVLLAYSNYSMYNSMLAEFRKFDEEKIFYATETLRNMWNSLQGTLKIVFIIINIAVSVGIFMWIRKNKDNFIEKCDFRI